MGLLEGGAEGLPQWGIVGETGSILTMAGAEPRHTDWERTTEKETGRDLLFFCLNLGTGLGPGGAPSPSRGTQNTSSASLWHTHTLSHTLSHTQTHSQIPAWKKHFTELGAGAKSRTPFPLLHLGLINPCWVIPDSLLPGCHVSNT